MRVLRAGWVPRAAVAASVEGTALAAAPGGRYSGCAPRLRRRLCPLAMESELASECLARARVSVHLLFCVSGCLPVSLAAQRGCLALLCSALQAAALAGCQSSRRSVLPSRSLGPPSNAGSVFPRSVPADLSYSALAPHFPWSLGVCREGARGAGWRSLSVSLSLSFLSAPSLCWLSSLSQAVPLLPPVRPSAVPLDSAASMDTDPAPQ
jgi:hypothetical protein